MAFFNSTSRLISFDSWEVLYVNLFIPAEPSGLGTVVNKGYCEFTREQIVHIDKSRDSALFHARRKIQLCLYESPDPSIRMRQECLEFDIVLGKGIGCPALGVGLGRFLPLCRGFLIEGGKCLIKSSGWSSHQYLYYPQTAKASWKTTADRRPLVKRGW